MDMRLPGTPLAFPCFDAGPRAPPTPLAPQAVSLSLLDFLFCFTGAELDLSCFSSPALAFGCRSLGDRSHPQIEHVGVPIGMTPAQSGQFFALAICSLFFDAALVGFSDQAWS